MGSQRRTKEQLSGERQKQILDAALAVFSRKGYGGSTVPDIAREAGVAVGTIYNYYRSKRDILVSALASNILSGPFLKLTEESPEASDKAFLKALIGDRLSLLSENAERFLFMLGEAYRDEEFRQRWAEEVVQPALARVERYVGSKSDSGAFRPLNASVTVRALTGMAIGFAVLAMVEGERSPCRGVPTEELAAQLADIALLGVRARVVDSAQP